MPAKSFINFILSIIALAGMFLIGLGIYKLVDKRSANVDMNITTTTNQNEKSITVDPRRVWSDTGIQIKKGQTVNITASGQINLATKGEGADKLIGPEGWGYIPALNCGSAPCRYIYRITESMGSLIGKIGKGEPFNIGASATITARDDGTLYLSVNDAVSDGSGRMLSDSEAAAQVFSNNSGRFVANVSVSGEEEARTVTVSAQAEDVDTGIKVHPGQTISITATGTVNSATDTRDREFKWIGPDGEGPGTTTNNGRRGPLPRGTSFMALCYRIGDGTQPVDDEGWLMAGSNKTFKADKTGNLHFTVNDSVRDETGAYRRDWRTDNQGAFLVTVKVSENHESSIKPKVTTPAGPILGDDTTGLYYPNKTNSLESGVAYKFPQEIEVYIFDGRSFHPVVSPEAYYRFYGCSEKSRVIDCAPVYAMPSSVSHELPSGELIR